MTLRGTPANCQGPPWYYQGPPWYYQENPKLLQGHFSPQFMQSQTEKTLTHGFKMPSHDQTGLIHETDHNHSIYNPTEQGLNEQAFEGGPSGTAEQEQTYHPPEIARAHDPQYLYRMELEKLPKGEIPEILQCQVLGQSKKTSELG